MSGFDAAWLALREDADRRARSPRLVSRLARAFDSRAEGEMLHVVDLGSGTGSTLRAIAHALPRPQRWLCIDDARPLLELCAREARDGVVVDCRLADLRDSLERCLVPPADLVTASALLDLVSRDWLERLVTNARESRALLYCAITCDGRLEWRPAHPADGAVRAAFNAHQRRDKGFGPALGPLAADALEERLRADGWQVDGDASDWQLDARSDRPLLAELLDGIAAAATEQEPGAAIAFEAWLAVRRAQLVQGVLAVTVGHRDVLARPPPQ